MDKIMVEKKISTEDLLRTRNDIDEGLRVEVINVLNQLLADTFDLFSQTKQAHWNLRGIQFIALHKLFDEFADGLRDHVDTIAERITALGGMAKGTVHMAAATSTLPDYPLEKYKINDTLHVLADRYAAVGKSFHQALVLFDDKDELDTSDLLIEVSRDLDKWLWFIEAHIETE